MRRSLACVGRVCALVAFAGCVAGTNDSQDPVDPPLLSDEGWTPVLPVLPEGWPALSWPAENPYSPAKAILGRRLFYERALSRDGTVSCEWCHAPQSAFTDKHQGGFGIGIRGQQIRRNPPSLVNLVFASALMLDGRAGSLEEQALFPLFAGNEMDMTGSEIEARLAADTLYVRLFRQAFGSESIRMENVAKALATYQRTLISYRAPFDRWQAGDASALSAEAKQGAVLFFGKAGCAQCHVPPLFTDGKFHNTGLDSVSTDRGRAEVTGLTADEGAFRTPTLRNIAQTRPYMHDARFGTLDQVVGHYNAGGHPRAPADSLLRPLGLTDREVFELI